MTKAVTTRRSLQNCKPTARIQKSVLKRKKFKGLPKISAGQEWVSDGSGRNIWLAKGKKIVRYAITRTESYMVAEAQETTELHGPVQCLCALTETEVLAVVGRKKGPQWLVGVSGDQHRKIAELKEAPLEVAVSGKAIVYLERTRSGATLVSLDRRTGRTIRQEPLNSAAVSMRAGRDGSVLLAERGGTLRYVSAARRKDDCRDPEPCNCGSQRPPSSVPPARRDCCCGCGDTKTPQPSPNAPNGTPNPRRPKDPDGSCVPGDDGIPEDCWVTTYLNGRMIRVNICDPVDPCTTQIPFRPAKIQTGRNRLFASSADGRRTLVLDSNSLRRVDSLQLPRGSQVFALAAGDDALLLMPDGALEIQDFAPAETPAANAAQASAPVTHLGVKPSLQYDTLLFQNGIRNVMIIPVLEPGQPYSGNTDEISQHYEMEDILERAQSYFEEVSYASPDNAGLTVNFVWFGADTPTLYTGPPVTLERPLKEYWGDPWVPGHIRAVIPAPAGTTVSFSGDEELRIRCRPAPETYPEQDFTVRFPAGSYRARIPNSSPTVTYEASLAPVRQISLTGTDRQGNPFSFTVDTSVLTGTHIVDLTRSALELNNDSLDALVDALEELLEAGAPDLFERPSVLWHDDGSETGMLHIAVSFADAPGGQPPELTDFAIDDLLNHISDPALSIGSIAARFDVNSDVSQLQTYFRRIVSDSHVRNSDFGSVLATSYFEMIEDWRPWVRVEGSELETRISLSTSHGSDPSRISLISQTGLAKLGYNAAIEGVGNDASFSGGGGPTFKDMSIFDEIYTAMIEASIAERGEATAASAFNQFFHCEGLENEPISCYQNSISSYVITPVYPHPLIGGTNTEPDLVNGERGAARSETMSDLEADNRNSEFKPISASFKKIVMKLANDSPHEDRAIASSATLSHELGHTLLGYRDLYDGGPYRVDVQYVKNLCLMGKPSSFSHFCAYHKRIKGWLSDDATIVFDRPQDGDPLDEEIILAQLEYFDPLVSPSEWSDIAQAALPGASAGLPVVAAAFLRLGGDGRQFNILELRGRGPRFSQELNPPRIGITNAIDPNDDTRYAETHEVEGSGTTHAVLERYRRFVHLLSTDLREATIGTDEATFDFATDPTFPEVGLTAELLEWGTASNAQGTFNLARVRLRWDRGPAINLGFQDATPDWQSPDIAVIKPEDIDPSDDSFNFPEMQEDTERFRIPAGDETLMHKIAVRVWNFGDATAENVQIGLLRRVPKGGGGGDWETDAEFVMPLPDPVVPSSQAEPPIVSFDWPVNSDSHTHLCFRAEIGDRDVPRDDNGVALASDDTDASNDWAQQNVFEFEAPADSPPDPVSFTFEVNNAGSYVETVSVVPVGLDDGATVTVYPSRMKIAPFSKGLFRVVVRLEERLLDAKCNKDIDFRLEVWRDDDHAQERWGSSRYVIKPRRRTQIELDGSIMPERVRLFGAVTPDVGAQDILLQIKRAGEQTIWERITLGPASTFDFELSGNFPTGEEVRATAYFDGSFEHASSVSGEVELNWILQG